ncbi:L,D-transpeptidase family protein [Paenibacillus xerothermodurans]|uniref:L,D-transpeptidase n=1 Tax=Paenibacillus xerothermodurans TaxID=1977292 RepID=A0A2W1NT41_PAEXE|nr:L,D-transpeptidase family protein [Paenibacillus xerothermodurans]PZE20946.1 L,D-transpeptidase [Paenibacillus xerothermodurans]
MADKDQEERLRLFFKHEEEPLHLKKYVRKHPTNKMAWYLLGRAYDAQGKHGKALYCYTQAGEIYEAFENQAAPIPPGIWLPPDRSQRRTRHGWLRLVRMVVISTLAVIGIAYMPAAPPASVQNVPAFPHADPGEAAHAKVYYVSGGKDKESVGAALREMLIHERANSYAILAYGKPTDDREWISWLEPPDLLLSVESKQDAGQQQISYHDAESCACQPSDPAKARAIFQSWAAEREQELILRSAIEAYMRKTGTAPEVVEELSQPYPNNILPGVTSHMQQLFDAQQAQQATHMAVPTSGQSAASKQLHNVSPEQAVGADAGGAALPRGLIAPLTEPLRIVVDKANHRLVLVSGGIIVRSYPVGLGAGRTPEGIFEISEKVRNPNGKSDGEFGSRGMTLSDTMYAIHGTDKPASVGKDESLGCIRMLEDDVEELFDMIPMGTQVTIGKGLLPTEIKRGDPAFRMPLHTTETNPGKVYKWLE